MNENALRFKELLANTPAFQEEMRKAANAYGDDRNDERAVFDAVIAPVARSAGMEFSYEETLAAIYEGRELEDWELDAIAGGVGVWQRIVAGALVAGIAVSSVPAAALAQEERSATPLVAAQFTGDDFFSDRANTESEAHQGDSTGTGAITTEAVAYSPDFDNDDIATPEGVEMTDDGIVVTDAAPRLVAMAAQEAGAPSKSSPSPSGQNDWDRTGKSIDYTREALGYVSKDAADVAGYGKVVFSFIKAGCLGDYSAAFGGGLEFLKLMGVLHKEGDISNKELMKEVKALKVLVEDMSQRLDENTKQTYQNRLVVFDNAVGMLDIDCQTAETMFAKAAKIADERGEGLPANLVGESARLEPPADPVYPSEPTITRPEQPAHIKNARPIPSQPRAEAYAEAHRAWEAECARIHDEHARQVAEYEAAITESHAYSQRLVRIAEEEEKSGNKDFKNFTKTMDGIETNFKLVAVECAKREGASPFYAFDSYWNMYFNFDTQGYYLRQAYRSNAEFQLKRSYALLGTYYDMGGYTGDEGDADSRQSLTNALASALNGIERFPAGNSPEGLRSENAYRTGFFYTRNVYSPTLGRTFNRSMFRDSLASIGIGDHYTEAQVKAYCSRLHGRTVAEDLRLAGVMIEYDPTWNDWYATRGLDTRVWPSTYLGLGVNHEVKDGVWLTRYVPFDATSYQLREYDADDLHFVLFLIND